MRKQVTVIECSRCKRVEHLAPNDTSDRSITIKMGALEPVKLEELCDTCQVIVGKLVEQIVKLTEKKSSLRKKKEKGEEKPPVLAQNNGAKREGAAPPSLAMPTRAPRG